MSTLLDGQVGFKAESTYGTAVTPDQFLEFTSESIKPTYQVLEGKSRRPAQRSVRSDRVVRGGMIGCTGSVTFEPLSKGKTISSLLSAVMGSVATSGPTETTVYTHTGEFGNLDGKSITLQIGKPDTSGTVRAFTYAGVKLGGLTLATDLDGILQATLDIAHAKTETTATALASATYTSGAELFSWVGGSFTIAGVTQNVSKASVSFKNNFDIRRYQGGATNQGEPLESGDREVRANLEVEFDSLTNLNYIKAATATAGQAKIVLVWAAPTLLGSTIYPNITVTLEVADITGDWVNVGGPNRLMLPIQAIARYDSTNSPGKIVVQSADTTA